MNCTKIYKNIYNLNLLILDKMRELQPPQPHVYYAHGYTTDYRMNTLNRLSTLNGYRVFKFIILYTIYYTMHHLRVPTTKRLIICNNELK
jgi:hypothetical protein